MFPEPDHKPSRRHCPTIVERYFGTEGREEGGKGGILSEVSGSPGHRARIVDPFHLPVLEVDGGAPSQKLDDGHELVTSHTDARRADTDGDRLGDAFELARGLDPLSPDTDRDGHLDGSFGQNQSDLDLDGLDDSLEQALGLNPQLADSDSDGFGDALELHAGVDPLSAQVNPLKAEHVAGSRGTVDGPPAGDEPKSPFSV